MNAHFRALYASTNLYCNKTRATKKPDMSKKACRKKMSPCVIRKLFQDTHLKATTQFPTVRPPPPTQYRPAELRVMARRPDTDKYFHLRVSK